MHVRSYTSLKSRFDSFTDLLPGGFTTSQDRQECLGSGENGGADRELPRRSGLTPRSPPVPPCVRSVLRPEQMEPDHRVERHGARRHGKEAPSLAPPEQTIILRQEAKLRR